MTFNIYVVHFMPSSYTLRNKNLIKHSFFGILHKNTIAFSTVQFLLSIYKTKCFLCTLFLFSFKLPNEANIFLYLLKNIIYKTETHRNNQRFINKSNTTYIRYAIRYILSYI